jgi:hypothetical protein
LIGAAIASVMASAGSTLYLASLRNANQQMRRLATAARRTDWSSPSTSGRYRRLDADVPEPDAEPTEEATPSWWSRWRWSQLRRGLPTLRRRWPVVAGLAVVVFAITIGTITAFEAGTNEPVSALLGGSRSSGTSLSHVLDKQPTKSTPTPSPSAKATPGAVQPTPSAGSSATPQPTSSPSGVAATPTPVPSASVSPAPSVPAVPTPATIP